MENKTAKIESEDRLRFETLMFDLSAGLVNVLPEQVSAEINKSLESITKFFDADRCSIGLFSEDGAHLTLAFDYVAPGAQPAPQSMAREHFPWYFGQLLKGKSVAISSIEDFPQEAEKERAICLKLGMKSLLSTPLVCGGKTIGSCALVTARAQRVWPEALARRFRLLSEVFANALDRREKEERLRAGFQEVKQHLRFEHLISNLSARFISLAPDQIDGEIQGSQRLICELHDLDRSALFQVSEIEPGGMVLTHFHQLEGSPPVSERMRATDFFPWTLQKVLSGEKITIVKMSDLPPEASRDRESYRLYGTQSSVIVPLSIGGGPVFGALSFAAVRKERDWSERIVQGFQLIAQVFANALARKRTDQEIRKHLKEIENLKHQLEKENIYLQEEIKLLADHGEIVGQSLAMKNVLSQAELVAPTDSTVLIQGETGTGKELLARAIHSLSSRKDRPLVTVNCASLPPTLIESELFGREKGAYTGALTKMIGRFEVADGSTLFLDEIGEIPLDVQGKLLRVFEEGSFERLGSTKALHVNVRIIAATNRNLGEEVKAGRFRKDLYYRLNVFPIAIPPLRERPEDIPRMILSFVAKLQKRMGKKIETIPKKTMTALKSYSWPGNVRELKNVVEHAMILSRDNTLVVRLPDSGLPETGVTQNLHDMEWLHVVSVLEKTGWRLSGRGGAAEILGLKRTTLQAKIKKLGIKRPNK